MRLFEGLAEEDQLDLVVDGEHTSTGDTTEDVSTGTLEEGSDTLRSGDLSGGIEGRGVFNSLYVLEKETEVSQRKRKKKLPEQ